MSNDKHVILLFIVSMSALCSCTATGHHGGGKQGSAPVVLTTSASCHLFSKDGRLISMEMNYEGDSGAHFIAPVGETIRLSEKHFMTWNDFPKPDILPKTRGVFATLSPGGNTMVGTVNEISYFALTSDPAFCQLFFRPMGFWPGTTFTAGNFILCPGPMILNSCRPIRAGAGMKGMWYLRAPGPEMSTMTTSPTSMR